jgi:hypothetical protein
VHREEIFAQLQQANRDAAQAPKQAVDSLPDFAKPADSAGDAKPDAPSKAPGSDT